MFSLWALDKRSLACLRIFLGCILFFDLLDYFPLANFYLSDQGFTPRIEFLSQQANPWNWSLLYTSGSETFVTLFLLWHLLTIVFFIIGFKTRFQTFFLWIQIVSMHNRNWVVTNGGDDLVRCILLILIFLPLGEVWSYDSRKKAPLSSMTTNSFLNFALFAQLSIMYVASAVFKNHPIWNEEYSALYYALNLDLFVRPFGEWVKEQNFLLKPLTALAYYFELFGVSLILLGLYKKWFTLSRYLLVLMFTGFHLGIDLMLNVGTFPYFAIALWSGFLPSHFWDSLSPQIASIQNKFNTLKGVFKERTKFVNNIGRSKIYLYNILGIFLTCNLLFWPLSDNNFNLNFPENSLVKFFRESNRWLATYQNWYLFAPYPKIDNVWVEITGELYDKTKVDLYRMKLKDQALTAEEVHSFYEHEKWRKILLKAENTPLYQNWLANYYCSHWNQIGIKSYQDKKLVNVKIISHNQHSTLRGIASRQRTENVLTSYQCP